MVVPREEDGVPLSPLFYLNQHDVNSVPTTVRDAILEAAALVSQLQSESDTPYSQQFRIGLSTVYRNSNSAPTQISTKAFPGRCGSQKGDLPDVRTVGAGFGAYNWLVRDAITEARTSKLVETENGEGAIPYHVGYPGLITTCIRRCSHRTRLKQLEGRTSPTKYNAEVFLELVLHFSPNSIAASSSALISWQGIPSGSDAILAVICIVV